jgi:phenylacetate-coenzyme A ligase PaaK-like adenylate-forming protein
MITKKEFDEIGTLSLEDFKDEREAKKYIIRTTSGTTGSEPLFIIRRKNNPNKEMDYYGDFKRVVGFFGSLNARLSHLSNIIYRRENSAILFIDNKDLNSYLDSLLKQFKPDSFCGFPSFIVKALEYIQDQKILEGIKHISYRGEYLSSAKQRILKNKLPNAKLTSFYAAAELGTLSSFCPYLSIGLYHPEDGVNVDIMNQDENRIGEIVISMKISNNVKVEKYLIGDIGRFVKSGEKCECGKSITFEVLGRKDFDYIKICGAIITQDDFERVVSYLKLYIADYRGYIKEIITHNNCLVGEIQLEIKPTDKLRAMKYPEIFIQEEISKRLYLTPSQTLRDLVEKNVFLPLRISFKSNVGRGGYKDVKLRKID